MAPPSFHKNNDALFTFIVTKGNGVKGLVDSGLTKVPTQYVQPPAERIDKREARTCNEPPIDLSKLDGEEHNVVENAIVKAAETLGFFQVVNHGVPLELLESLKGAAHKFFTQLPEKKAVYLKGVSCSPYVNYGTSFVPEKERALEWKDYVSMVYTNADDALLHWPSECKEVALEYLKTSTNMIRRLVKILIDKLGAKLDDSILDSLIRFKMVNMNFYPACPNPDETVGVGRHSDMGTLTVLLQDGIGGLHVRVEGSQPDGTKVQWMDIPPIEGALVINVGDTLEILSNGRYKSAEHRVRTTSLQSRVSVPIFSSPLPSEKIGPLPEAVEANGVARYQEVVFKDYMDNFFGKAHQGKKSQLDFAKPSP